MKQKNPSLIERIEKGGLKEKSFRRWLHRGYLRQRSLAATSNDCKLFNRKRFFANGVLQLAFFSYDKEYFGGFFSGHRSSLAFMPFYSKVDKMSRIFLKGDLMTMGVTHNFEDENGKRLSGIVLNEWLMDGTNPTEPHFNSLKYDLWRQTILHEMAHAYLNLTKPADVLARDGSHGPIFRQMCQELANKANVEFTIRATPAKEDPRETPIYKIVPKVVKRKLF